MRHRKKKNKLSSRTRGHLKADVSNLVNSLILNGKIRTTRARAKMISSITERYLNRIVKEKSSRQRKLIAHQVFSSVKVEKKLFSTVLKAIESRKSKGGFIRVTKVGFRNGDNAPLCQIEIIMK